MKPIPSGFQAHHEPIEYNDLFCAIRQSDPQALKHSEQPTFKYCATYEAGFRLTGTVKHIASDLPRRKVHLIRESTSRQETSLYSTCQAFNELGEKLAEGTLTQVVMLKKLLEQPVKPLEAYEDAYCG